VTGRELLDVVRAESRIAHAWLRLKTRSRGSLVRIAESPLSEPPSASDVERAQQLAIAIDRASRFGPFRTTCLVRASALHELIRRDGIGASRIRVGVRMQDGNFAAHAWVELGDLVIGDRREHVLTFTPVSEISVALV
jgi:hypothetical protein